MDITILLAINNFITWSIIFFFACFGFTDLKYRGHEIQARDVTPKQKLDRSVKMFNLARRKKAKERSDTEIWSDQMLQMEILDTERRLQEVISPVESYIMMTQSILVWENPQYTSVMFVCANILFW